MKLVIASRNEGKIREIKEILSELKLEIFSLKDYPNISPIVERGRSFEENAKEKAKVVANLTGEISLADDSGVEVFALGGIPGLKSSEFAATDRERIQKLLSLLEGVPLERRGAKFNCAIAIARPGGEVVVVKDECYGLISLNPRGKGGFGYDPLFIAPEYGKTFAELPREVKNRISHRAKALSKAKPILMKIIKEKCLKEP